MNSHIDSIRSWSARWVWLWLLVALTSTAKPAAGDAESFAPLGERGAPDSFEALWDGYDPSSEPLESEVLHEWEEDGVVLRVVRFRIGVFKGKKAVLAGVYGYPKGQDNLPGLLQVHGGGQYADYRAPLYNAKRGYATLSIAWAGRISAPQYNVNSDGVRLYLAGDPNAPGYKRTTDWGAVDGYHAPRRSEIGAFDSDKPGPWTLDAVDSPRNSGWFLATVAARRGLTFLANQPEVDADRLGVYGHSMGGKITVLTTAADKRVKAAAPSCGGISHRDTTGVLFQKTLSDHVCLKQIGCPIIFLSPSNDFHGRIDDLPSTVQEIKTEDWRVTCSPHLNHRDTGEYASTAMLWFDQHLNQRFKFPRTPTTKLNLNAGGGTPEIDVVVDPSMPIERVDVFYTQQGKAEGEPEDFNNTRHRFWHHAEPTQAGDRLMAKLPLSTTDRPLWVYVNVRYKLERPVVGAGYYFQRYEASSFVLSSVVGKVEPKVLSKAGCKATLKPSGVIEDFQGDWRKQWFTHKPEWWSIRTNKLNDPAWHGPEGAALAIEVRSDRANKLVVGLDDYAAVVELTGGEPFERILLTPVDFSDAKGQRLSSWTGLRQLRLVPTENLVTGRGKDRAIKTIGSPWKGADPEFHLIEWKVPKEGGEQEALAPGYLQVGPSMLTDVFPAPTFQAERPGGFSATARYAPSPGPWMEGMDERGVFRAALKHEQDPLNSYELRMGVGGQIYSLQGAFGESVPPSWRGNGATSPWNDEVWQFVAVCSRYNKAGKPQGWLEKAAPYETSFFVHNSGCYMNNAGPGVDLKNLYCPLLASELDMEERVYRQLNWGMVPQMRTIHRSPVLFYTQARDAGEGVIELTWVVHNFSTREDVVFDYLNAPWGGTRVSSLPLTYVAQPDGGLTPDVPGKNDSGPFANAVDVRKTGGFTISSADDTEDSPSLALVFGLDKHREAEAQRKKNGEAYVQHRPTRYRSWLANHPAYRRQWKDFKNIPANSFRNYQVMTLNPHLLLRPQETIWYRTYLVVGGKQRCAELAKTLVDHVDYGRVVFDKDTTPMVDLPGLDKPGSAKLYAHPVAGTLPVFAIRQKPDGKVIYTTDPYRFTPQKKLDLPVPKGDKDYAYFSQAVGYALDGQTEFLGLLGYARWQAPADRTGWTRLSEAAPGHWDGQADAFHVDVWVRTGRPSRP